MLRSSKKKSFNAIFDEKILTKSIYQMSSSKTFTDSLRKDMDAFYAIHIHMYASMNIHEDVIYVCSVMSHDAESKRL